MSFKADAAKIKRWREERYWSQEHVARKNAKTRAAIWLSLWIHLAGYAIGVVVFVGISIGIGGNTFVMKWPLIWWTVGFVSHIATVLIVHVATRYQEQVETAV